MSSVLLAIDIILAVVLTILVLLQRSEGGALGALGGGSGNSIFTGRQAGNMLTRLTWWSFALFVAVNLALVVLAKKTNQAEPVSLVPTVQTTPADENAAAENAVVPTPVENAPVENAAAPTPVENASVENAAEPVPVENAPAENATAESAGE